MDAKRARFVAARADARVSVDTLDDVPDVEEVGKLRGALCTFGDPRVADVGAAAVRKYRKCDLDELASFEAVCVCSAQS